MATAVLAFTLTPIGGVGLDLLGSIGISEGFAQGAVVGALSGASGSAINGGNAGDILRGAVVGGIQGGIAGSVLHDWESTGWSWETARHVAGHGVVGGAANEAMGGKFQDGFLSAAASAAAGDFGLLGNPNAPGFSAVASRTIRAGIIGGTASALGGGKFANGAWTSAFQHLLNAEVRHLEKYFFRLNDNYGMDPRGIIDGKWWGPGETKSSADDEIYYHRECLSGAQYWCGHQTGEGTYDAPLSKDLRKGPEVLSASHETLRQAAVDAGHVPYFMIAKSAWDGPNGSYRPGHTMIYLGSDRKNPNIHWVIEQFRGLPSGARIGPFYSTDQLREYNVVTSSKRYDSGSFTKGNRYGY